MDKVDSMQKQMGSRDGNTKEKSKTKVRGKNTVTEMKNGFDVFK